MVRKETPVNPVAAAFDRELGRYRPTIMPEPTEEGFKHVEAALTPPPKPDLIDHPPHYNFSAIEPIDVIEAWELGFNDGQVIKYLARAGRKDGEGTLKDKRKALWYLTREISRMEKAGIK